jgi:uncharacterized membrane protein
MDGLPVYLLYFSKEVNVKSTTKDTKTIHAKINKLLHVCFQFAVILLPRWRYKSREFNEFYGFLPEVRIKGV